MRRTLLVVFAVVSLGSEARADVPPPRGTKRMGVAFSVDGLEKFPDRVLFAYPCSSSSGAPVAELVPVRTGEQVRMGLRGGGCQLYGMAKADFVAWQATYTPTHTFRDPAADALVAGANVVKCQGGPSAAGLQPDTTPGDVVRQSLSVLRLDVDGCVVTDGVAPAPAPPPQSGQKGGCAGCEMSRTSHEGALALGLALAAFARRRRAKPSYVDAR